MIDTLGEFKNIAETLFNNAAGGLVGLPPPSAQKVFLSVCYGTRRARTVKGIGGTLRAAFAAALERALKIVSQKETPPKWVMANVVEKEISCPAAEYYDILNRIKPGYLRYGVSFDNRYATVFLEQEIHAAAMLKYGKSGYSLDAAKITDYLRTQGVGGAGVTFSAPAMDSPVVLFEVKSWFYDDGEYFEIDSSPASLRSGQRVVNFEEKPESRVETARRVVAACFAADCRTDVSAGGFAAQGGGGGTQISDSSSIDDAARFSASLPAVMFPEMAMFFESPESVVYGVFIRGKNFDERDSVAARFFTDYYNQRKNGMDTGNEKFSSPKQTAPPLRGTPPRAGNVSSAHNRVLFPTSGGVPVGWGGPASAEIQPKIITANYNPNTHRIAEIYGLSAGEFENMYDFFQNAVETDAGNVGQYKVEKVCDPAKKTEKHAIHDYRGFLSCERLIASEERLVMSEIFFTPPGEKVIEKSYRVEDGKSEVMAVRVKFDGTWRCFSDDEELLVFYYEKSVHARNERVVKNGMNQDVGVENLQPLRCVQIPKDESHANIGNQQTWGGGGGITLSIIIPHYNRAELVMMCLDSIAVNDYPQELYEVIIVDDCSKENTDAVRAYSKIKNFHFCQLTKNSGGASAPRNYGITQAQGEYAMFIDSDDMISARLLSESMRIARAGDCDAVVIPKISQRSTAAAFRTLTDDLTKIKLDGLSDLSVLAASDNYAIGKLFRMDLIKRFGIHFPENLVYSEDTCFCRWFYAVSKTMGICASESYFLRDWDGGTLSHYIMSPNEIYEHVSFITRKIFSVPDEFAPVDKKARAIDGSVKLKAVRALNTPYYTALLQEKYGGYFAVMRDAPRISKETREFIDAIIHAKQATRSKEKLEVVFMPYRASTWDSLESIWLAAKGDPDCDVYVVPLPYADPKSGGLVCDAENLPAYVPVTLHSEYDLCGRLPDIVYINDPYDQYREIAPIDEKYYSYNLKKYTGMLVYVPYYGLGVSVNLDTETHKVLVHVSAHVDKVITQSEKFSACYAKEAAPNKLAALGTPKIDKVIKTKKENYPLPDGWKRIIGDKKIILYNTHLVNIRDPKRDMIAKLRYVMSVFEKRGDAVLWWRPHPSIEAELKTRNPRGFEVYSRLVEEYKAAGAGIYDDTPDLHRALAWSGTYYGDGSSLTRLCGVAGKPMMIQDAVRKNEDSGGLPSRAGHDLMFFDVYDDGENFWFTAENFNALFKMDKQSWTAEYMGSFPNEMNVNALYGRIIEHGGKLYFTPRLAREIAVYDIASGKFEKISFAEPENCADKEYYNVRTKFCAAAAYGKHIFFLGVWYPAIMRLDTESGRLDYFTDWVEPLAEISGAGAGCYFWNAAVSENKIYMPAASANAVSVFDMDKCVSQVYEVGSKGQKHHGICFDGANYWLAPRFDGAIVRWNPATKECREYGGYPAGYKFSRRGSFGAVKYWGGHVWLLPCGANMALKIDVSDGSMSIAEEFMGECEFNGKKVTEWNYFFLSSTAGDKLYSHTGKSNRFTEYDFKTKQLREEETALSEEDVQRLKLNENLPALFYKNIRWRLSVWDYCFYEIHSSLPDFINYAVNESEGKTAFTAKQVKAYSALAANVDGTCGAKIHEYVKNETLNRNRP